MGLLSLCLLCVVFSAYGVQSQTLLGKHRLTRLYGPCNYTSTREPCTTRQGKIVMGAFFPLHEWDYSNNNCSTTFRSESGFQRMEAFRWAVEKYGGRLSGFAEDGYIGYDIRDSCSKDTHTRDEALEFINVGTNCQLEFQDRPVSIVVGASSSGVSMDLTNLQALFDVPQVSYASTSDRLNDSERFSKFVRVVPPDVYQVRAMISLLEYFSWSYVSVVYTDDEYGVAAFERLDVEASTYGGKGGFHFCLAARQKVSLAATKKDYINALAGLSESSDSDGWHDRSHVVIVFAQAQTASELLKTAMENVLYSTMNLTWIASDAWSGSIFTVKDALPITWGLLSVKPFASHNDPDVVEFDRKLRSMTINDFPQHKWSNEFFHQLFADRNCTFNNSSENSAPNNCRLLTVGDSHLYAPDHKLPFVILSVRVAIQSLIHALQTNCQNSSLLTLCTAAQTDGAVEGTLLTNSLLSSALGLNLTLNKVSRAYLSNDVPYRYAVYNLVRKNPNGPLTTGLSQNFPVYYKYIGSWSTTGSIKKGQLTIENTPTFNTFDGKPPISVCARTCLPGYKRIIPIFAIQQSPRYCCWRCEACLPNEFAFNNTSPKCTRCPPTQTHNRNQTNCIDIEKKYLEFSDPLGVFIMAVAVIGCILTATVGTVLLKYRRTPLVMASSRELSACLLLGFMMSYSLTFAFIGKPTPLACGVRRLALGFPVSLCLGALLVKTNRISRLFNRKPGMIRPRYTSPEWQLVFTAVFVSIQVRLICKNSISAGIGFTQLYNMFLVFSCLYFGFKTRKIPANFNEARYIFFSMCTVGLVWFAFIPAYLTTGTEYEAAMLALPLLLSMMALLGFLFFPKLYIILITPEVNVRNTASTARRRSRARRTFVEVSTRAETYRSSMQVERPLCEQPTPGKVVTTAEVHGPHSTTG